jgi:hypothetical protein
MSEQELEVCDACGWYSHKIRDKSGRVFLDNTARECDPGAGRLADRLFALVPEAQATKLGWGCGHVALGVLDDFQLVVRLEVSGQSFRLRGVDAHGPVLTLEDAADLTRSLLAWHTRRMERHANHASGSPHEARSTDGDERP